MKRSIFNTFACLVFIQMAACSPSSQPMPVPVADEHAGHDHGHSHEDTGPNGGHLVELGNEEFHIEWTHDDSSGLVTLYVLDGAAKELVPIPGNAITITAKVKEETNYDLPAVAPSGDPPAASKFELKSPELLVNLQMAGQGADVSVALTIDGKEFRGEFEHHDHGHHH